MSVCLSAGKYNGRMSGAVVELNRARGAELRFYADDCLVSWTVENDPQALSEALATLDKLRAGVAEAIASLLKKEAA